MTHSDWARDGPFVVKALHLLHKSGLIFLVTVAVALLVVACASRPTPPAAPGSGSIIDDFPLGTFLAPVPDLAVTLLGVAALDQGLPGHTAILSSTAFREDLSLVYWSGAARSGTMTVFVFALPDGSDRAAGVYCGVGGGQPWPVYRSR